ncbi:transposase [Cohnella abietis]|uniref:Transposase zinc-ribbon domain-containing protein n=1 Tax=Cohnella abietis TaxID=2507935 RepID=A0A3T1D801_9BACL|nr:transposase [Cohnella abietis]BBI34210.1 hypothetical protein KCTCHS21_36090 [Cohnella abietis]
MRAMSIRRFMEQFPDEQACRDYLFQVRWPRGFICTKCGENQYTLILTRHLYECSNCRTQISITANTVMHRTKLPLSYWLLTFYWVASGEQCSARKIAKTLQVQYRTALRLLDQVRYAMFRAEYDALFSFWLPNDKHATPYVVKKGKHKMVNKAGLFIKRHYRHVSPTSKHKYFYEYRFRSINQYDPAAAIDKLINSGSSTIYSLNEYHRKTISKKATV